MSAIGVGKDWNRVSPSPNRSAPWLHAVTVGLNYSPGQGQAGEAFLPCNPETFSYDADGNLLSDGRWNYSWDAENRLVRMETRAEALAAGVPKQRLQFTYDYQGRRIRKRAFAWAGEVWELVSDHRLVYDGWNLLAVLGPESSVLQSFLWGLDLSGSLQGAGGVGGLLAMTVHGGQQPETYFYAYDGNGNVMALLHAPSSALHAQYEYGPFGEPLRITGSMAKENPFRFSTKRTDNTTDLVLYEYRVYNPSTGRWLNRDPIGEQGGLNLYEFVGNNPVNLIDSDGRAPMGWPVVPPPCYPPSLPPRAPSDTSIRKCNRKIENPSNDFVIACANLRGHDYFDWPDGHGGRDGIGYPGQGPVPTSEAGAEPRSCRPCYKSKSPLKHGTGAGKSGTSATDEEIKDCLKNRPFKGKYHGLCNNCNDWARGAANDCGLFCP